MMGKALSGELPVPVTGLVVDVCVTIFSLLRQDWSLLFQNFHRSVNQSFVIQPQGGIFPLETVQKF